MDQKKQHRKFLIMNDNTLYRIYFHSHYNKIKLDYIELDINKIIDITDFYNVAIILHNNNNLTIIDDTIITVDTSLLSDYDLKNVFICSDRPDIDLISFVNNKDDTFNCIMYTIELDNFQEIPYVAYTGKIGEDIEKFTIDENTYNCKNKEILIDNVWNSIDLLSNIKKDDIKRKIQEE